MTKQTLLKKVKGFEKNLVNSLQNDPQELQNFFNNLKEFLKPDGNTHFTFGKYKGRKYKDIKKLDPGYFLWLKRQEVRVSSQLKTYIERNYEFFLKNAPYTCWSPSKKQS